MPPLLSADVRIDDPLLQEGTVRPPHEFIAVRTILLVLHTDILRDREITEERIKLALERADAVKLAIADKRISAFFSERAKGIT